MRRLTITTALLSTLPGLAAAQERVTFWDVFSMDRLVQQALQSGIMALRTQVDLTYGGLDVDLIAGRVSISDVRAWPLPDWDEDGSCAIKIDKLTLRGNPLDAPETLLIKARATGVSLPVSCLPPDAGGPLKAVGIEELIAPRLTVDIEYGVPASDAELRLHADLTGLAAVDLSADMAYVWVDGRDDIEEPLPVVFLEHAALSIEDSGLYAKVAPLLPPPLTGEGAGLFIEGALGQELIGANRSALGDEAAELSPAQAAFLSTLAEAWPAFVADPQMLVLETQIDGDVFVDFELIEDDPTEAFEALQPVVALRPAARSEIIPAALLSSALSDASALSDEERMQVGMALITGAGAPRSLAAGIALLEDAAKSGNGDAALALADGLASSDPSAAYAWALSAGAAGESAAITVLDRLERAMTLANTLELQQAHSGGDPLPKGGMTDLAVIRASASSHLSGKGAPRNYARAAMFASLAAAAGDREAADILTDLSEMARLAGAQAEWSAAEAEASKQAMQIWLDKDLATVFSQ